MRISTSPLSRAKLSSLDTEEREVRNSVAIAPMVRSCR